MSYIERKTVPVTTDAAGAATVYSPVINGAVVQIAYVKTDFDNGVNFSITLEGTGEQLWVENAVNASKTVAPRQLTHTTAGVATVYYDLIAAGNDRVKIVIAAGGNVKAGTFHILIG